MANYLTAINSFRPKLKLGKSVTIVQLIEYIASRTGLNKGPIQLVLADSVVFFTKQGNGVKLDGLGTYLPSIDTDGKISISHRLDPYIRKALNVPGAFTGEIENRSNIGKTKEEFIALWNEAHPDDPIVLN